MISQATVEREREPDAVSFGLRPGRMQGAGWWAHIKSPVRQGNRVRQRPDHKSLMGPWQQSALHPKGGRTLRNQTPSGEGNLQVSEVGRSQAAGLKLAEVSNAGEGSILQASAIQVRTVCMLQGREERGSCLGTLKGEKSLSLHDG